MEKSPVEQRRKLLLKEYRTSLAGLSSAEAAARLKQFGLNEVVEKNKFNAVYSLFEKFKNPLIGILFIAALISIFTGAYLDGVIIIIMILLSVCIDFFQEYQSNQAAEKLKQKVAIKVTVTRDNAQKEVLVARITRGDIINLEIGSVVPADMIVLSTKDLHVDESSLTGESFPVQKDEFDELYMGTTVMNGEGIAVVTKIGKETQFGHIAEKLSSAREETDFERGVKEFGLLVTKLALVLVSFILIVNVLLKHSIFESLLFAIALAVGLTPELLPMILTVNLSKGALRMARKGIIVKHLPSIQNLGSMDVLCTDKTGTITENKIRLERYENIHGDDDQFVLEQVFLNSYYQSNLKSPLDEAVLAHKMQHHQQFKKLDEIPFDFIRRRLSVVLKRGAQAELICKGAPESVLEHCTTYCGKDQVHHLTPEKRHTIVKRFHELSQQGFRVLAVAMKSVPERECYTLKDESELSFVGLTAFLDPPKHDVKDILKCLSQYQVSLKVLTGDNELVTQKVCEEVGLEIKGVKVGKEIAQLSDAELDKIVQDITIFARLTPDQKDRIIHSLRRQKCVVGFLGDGVNDATSLRSADVGISVNNAVDVAKGAADLILVHKSLSVLKDAIEEGRKTFANTIKYIFMMMGSNFGNMVSLSLASLFIPFLPILPIQILLNNLIYDVSQLTLPLDSVDSVDLQKPARWDVNNLRKFILIFGPISSLFDLLTFGSLLYLFNATIPFFRTAWFVESIVTQSLIILALRTKIVPFYKSEPARAVLLTALGAAAFSIWMIRSPVAQFFQFISLPSIFWGYLFLVVLLYFTLVELAKVWLFGKQLHPPSH